MPSGAMLLAMMMAMADKIGGKGVGEKLPTIDYRSVVKTEL
jgi:hypothetical protein